jgi:hypothetical protein
VSKTFYALLALLSLTAGSDAGRAQNREPAMACNRSALTPDARKRHFEELTPALRARRTSSRELADGFEFEFPSDPASLQLVNEWVAGERLCCPFFEIAVRLEPDGGPLWLRLTGRKGVKDFIAAEFGPRHVGSGHALEVLFNNVENRLVTAADAMPADKYSFVPASGEFKGVRNFAQQVKHAAAANYILSASVLGVDAPPDAGDETGPDEVRRKAQIVEYLKGSFTALRKALNAIDEQNEILEKITPLSPLHAGTTATRLGLVVEALLHDYDHYGQMVEYLRMNGIVPPASRPSGTLPR